MSSGQEIEQVYFTGPGTTWGESQRRVKQLQLLSSENDLKNCMRPRRVTVRERDARCAHWVAMLDQLHYLISACDVSLLHSYDLNLLFAVLQHSQLLFVVQQVKHLRQRPAHATIPHHLMEIFVSQTVLTCALNLTLQSTNNKCYNMATL